MEIPRIALKTSSKEKRNDLVYDEVFRLFNSSYNFVVFPKSKFWRFGIRLSRTEEITFDLSNPDRHSNKEFKDLHLSVGNPNSQGIWENPNILELTQYHFGDPNLLSNRCDKYFEGAPIEFHINYNKDLGILETSYSSDKCFYETKIPLVGYKYFKIFAWADGIPFELEFVAEQMYTDYPEVDYENEPMVKGLVAADDTDWFEYAMGSLQRFKYIILWWDKLPSGSNLPYSTLTRLRETLNVQSYFELYYTRSKSAHYRAVVKDFATRENFNANEWKSKYKDIEIDENFDDYEGTRRDFTVRKARIVFVVELLEKVEPEFPVSDFTFLHNYSPPTQNNLQPYIDIHVPQLEDQPTVQTIFVETTNKFSVTNNFEGTIGVNELAEEMYELILNLKDPTGNMIGIFGQWGRGKTFFWNRILNVIKDKTKTRKSAIRKYYDKVKLFFEFKQEESKDPSAKSEDVIHFDTIEFHAWKYQDTPASWAYLYENLSDKYLKGNVFKKTWRIIKLNFKRHGILNIFYFLLTLAFSITFSFLIPFETKLNAILFVLSSVSILTIIKLILLYSSYKPKAINLLNKYSEKVSFHKYLGIQAEIQKEIACLVTAWIKNDETEKKKIIVFVDDIDRCEEEKIIKVIDSFKVMLEDEIIAKRIIILMAIDERVLKMAIKNKYYDLVNRNFSYLDGDRRIQLELDKLAKEYIDKLFILGIKLGNLTLKEKKGIFDGITEGKVGPNKVDSLANEKKTIEEVSEELEEEVLSDQSLDDIKETKAKPTVVYGDDRYEIEEFEYKYLLAAINKCTEITPRGARIFYYRYLLAKRIMRLRLIRGSLVYNKWNSGVVDKSILPDLLIKYSLEIKHDELAKEKEKHEKKTGIVDIELFNYTRKLDARLYYELLNIVEIVVPY